VDKRHNTYFRVNGWVAAPEQIRLALEKGDIGREDIVTNIVVGYSLPCRD